MRHRKFCPLLLPRGLVHIKAPLNILLGANLSEIHALTVLDSEIVSIIISLWRTNSTSSPGNVKEVEMHESSLLKYHDQQAGR